MRVLKENRGECFYNIGMGKERLPKQDTKSKSHNGGDMSSLSSSYFAITCLPVHGPSPNGWGEPQGRAQVCPLSCSIPWHIVGAQ